MMPGRPEYAEHTTLRCSRRVRLDLEAAQHLGGAISRIALRDYNAEQGH